MKASEYRSSITKEIGRISSSTARARGLRTLHLFIIEYATAMALSGLTQHYWNAVFQFWAGYGFVRSYSALLERSFFSVGGFDCF